MEAPRRYSISLIGEGSEGTIYKYEDYALKYFLDYSSLKNKVKKINKLKQLKIDNFCFPIDFVTNNSAIIGYYMDYIDTRLSMNELFKNASLDEKIKYLKMQENLVKKAHENNIVICDLNLFNFLVNDDKLYAIDTDNYKIGNLENDIIPDLYGPYYFNKISTKVDENFDKFALTVNFLRCLKEDFYPEMLYLQRDSFDYLEEYINELNIPSELKDFLYYQISDNETKEFLGNNMDLVSSEKRFIK